LHAPVVGAVAGHEWAEAAVPVRLAQGNSRVVLLGRRQGGQRYLGEDLEALAKAAAEIAGKVESLRQEEMTRLVSQAELRALQSQINPHFLFNALNTLYGTIPRESSTARRMVLNLADIFRYFLQSDKTFVTLAEEMQIVKAYLEVEQSRLGDRLAVRIDVDDAALAVTIPVLSVQPLVENAIKHGVAQRTEPGFVRIAATPRRRRFAGDGGEQRRAARPDGARRREWGSRTCAGGWRSATARAPICASISSRRRPSWSCTFRRFARRQWGACGISFSLSKRAELALAPGP
jgi:hypothetical protein